MATQEDIAELLETAASKAYAKDAAKRASDKSSSEPHARHGDHSDRYSSEREGNNKARERRSRDLNDVEMREAGQSPGMPDNGDSPHRRSHGRDSSDGRPRSARDSDDVSFRGASERNKANANGDARDRRRSRSPDPNRRTSSRERNGYRDRDRISRGDYYDGGGRSFREDDSYRPGRYDDRDRDSDSHRDRRPDDRDSRRYRGGARGGAPRRSPESKKAKTPEPTDDERDRRTVFVQQLAARLRTKELKAFFEQVGGVVDAQIVKDRVSGRSKGVGYVEFREEDSVQKAIGLTGQKLLGIPIIVQLTEAEKNRQARVTEGTATQSNGIPFHRLYVGNIHFSITEDDLKNVFEPFGELEFVQLQKEEQGRSKGYGFVQFIDPTQAKEALEKMNGFELAGRPIRVGLGNDKFTNESTQSLLQRFGSQAQQAQFQGSAFSGSGGRGAHAGGTGNFDRAGGRNGDKTGGASALDDTDVAGVNFSNYSRDALMRKLARTDEPEQKIAPKTQAKPMVVDQPAPSRCVVIKNLYDQSEETEPNWQEDVKEDIRLECEEKYGKVVHLDLALNNNDGEAYVKFDSIKSAQNAIHGLNGRFFDKKTISAQFVVEAVYHMNFPKAASL